MAEADDEYLIGLSNKGIVKRAYKDLEIAGAQIGGIEDCVEVQTGGETVKIKNPLGSSQCSCPSRTICRHVMTAILALREKVCSREAPEAAASAESGAVRAQMRAIPLTQLKKAMTSRQYLHFLEQVRAGKGPEILGSAVITVRFADPERIVKLLSPLEHSSCSCHKKELCAHKAEAILWCLLKFGELSLEDVQKPAQLKKAFDTEKIHAETGQMLHFLGELWDTGLSRTSPDVPEQMERMAIMSHILELSNQEGEFRALAGLYRNYFRRSSAFNIRELLEKLSELYDQLSELLQVQDDQRISRIVGSFKAAYLPVGDLTLYGITSETFESKNGYAGERIYFLEEGTRKWYTYTVSRPIFYENSQKRRPASGMQETPWGLALPLKKLSGVKLRLENARADERNRLSSGQETKGEVLGESDCGISNISNWFYDDFAELFAQRILKKDAESGPVFLKPEKWDSAVFSEVDQMLFLSLWDRAGKEVILEIPYSKKEADSIRFLERLTKKREGHGGREADSPVFLGKVYLRENRIRLYPLQLMENGIFSGDKKREDDPADLGDAAERYAPMDRHASMKRYDALEALISDIRGKMEALFQSGFASCSQDAALKLSACVKTGERYGLQRLSELLEKLEEALAERLHSMNCDPVKVWELYGKILKYLKACSEKIEMDRARLYYTVGETEKNR